MGTIFCLQEDSDMAYFDLDLQPILHRCQQRGDIKHVRWVPAQLVGQHSLRCMSASGAEARCLASCSARLYFAFTCMYLMHRNPN